MGDRSKKVVASKIPPVNELINRFDFIENEILQENIATSFQYVIFLIAVIEEEGAENSTISSSIYKNIILYTGAIVEGCVHYALRKFIDEGVVRSADVMNKDWAYKDEKKLYKISEEERVIGVISHLKVNKLTDKTNFILVNRACKRAGILDRKLFEKVEELREKRNKIHLVGLRNVDNRYVKRDAQKFFDIAREVIEVVEEKLKGI
ncbi:hypothetical protein ACFL2R_01080 [Patescibacteria group bacterium]